MVVVGVHRPASRSTKPGNCAWAATPAAREVYEDNQEGGADGAAKTPGA
jgi:hypothetical protein